MAYGAILGQAPIIPENPQTIATNVSYNNSSTSSIITGTNVQIAIDQLFTSVSNGKSLIASAITDKGISTASNATFQTMANNIRNISTGYNVDYGSIRASNYGQNSIVLTTTKNISAIYNIAMFSIFNSRPSYSDTSNYCVLSLICNQSAPYVIRFNREGAGGYEILSNTSVSAYVQSSTQVVVSVASISRTDFYNSYYYIIAYT